MLPRGREVNVRGRVNAPLDMLAAAVDVKRGDPILSLDLDAVRHRLESIGWVKQATVWRQLPDTLNIEIEERQPFARPLVQWTGERPPEPPHLAGEWGQLAGAGEEGGGLPRPVGAEEGDDLATRDRHVDVPHDGEVVVPGTQPLQLEDRGVGRTTHRLGAGERVDGVAVLHEGAVLAEGPIDAVSANERVVEVYLGR